MNNPLVSIIMGSTSDLPVMEKACQFLNDMQIPFEVNALSAHRTPQAVERFAKEAEARGLKVIIAGGCSSARSYCGVYHSACYWCTYQRNARRIRCDVEYYSDASRYPCCHCWGKRSNECSHFGNGNVGAFGCGCGAEVGKIQVNFR